MIGFILFCYLVPSTDFFVKTIKDNTIRDNKCMCVAVLMGHRMSSRNVFRLFLDLKLLDFRFNDDISVEGMEYLVHAVVDLFLRRSVAPHIFATCLVQGLQYFFAQ